MAFEGFKSWTEKLKEKSKEADAIEFKNFDEVEKEAPEVKAEEPAEEPARSVVGATDSADSNLELKVVRPESLAEVSTIADYLLDKCTVVLNLELLDENETTRMLDFLNGVRYSTDGDLQAVSQSTYIITPHNVDISDK
jgi:cell division inhibitor SepF